MRPSFRSSSASDASELQRAADIFYGPLRWSEKVRRLRALVEAQPIDNATRYLERANAIAKLTSEPGELEILKPAGGWGPFGDRSQQPYGLIVRHQCEALHLLEELGAMDEIAAAVISHCEEFRPEPPYRPKLLQGRLVKEGWTTEVRVPPPSPDLDDLPINEKYDALKFFPRRESEVGVAVEIEKWEINNDLIKLWRGFTRGQIAVGVLILEDPSSVRYCFEHMRLLTKPLFGHVPIVFLAPDGPGLKQSIGGEPMKYGPFPMPQEGASP